MLYVWGSRKSNEKSQKNNFIYNAVHGYWWWLCEGPSTKSKFNTKKQIFCVVFLNGYKDYVERQRSNNNGGNRILKGALVHMLLWYDFQNTRKQNFCGVFLNEYRDHVERQRSNGSGVLSKNWKKHKISKSC